MGKMIDQIGRLKNVPVIDLYTAPTPNGWKASKS